MFIDTHCHLYFPQFDEDRAMVIGNAKKAGVKRFICPGVDLHSTALSAGLAAANPGVVFPAAGIHPYEAQKNVYAGDLQKFIHPQTVAVGECGLDYHIYKGETAAGKKDNQKRLLDDQLRLALQLHLPVILHCRDAFDDFFQVLDGLPSLPRGVVHCFGGGLTDLRMALERNLWIGIDGNVTYSKQLEVVVPHIPLAKLLLETDAPYLTPVPHRGSRNEPKYIPLVAAKIADVMDKPPETIAAETTRNANALFQIA